MMKRIVPIVLLVVFSCAFPVFAETTVKGTIQQIADDGSSLVVDGKKIITDKDFIDEAYFEVGDKVEIVADETPQGLKARSYEYIFDEEGTPYDDDQGTESIEDQSQDDMGMDTEDFEAGSDMENTY
jgi:hypothetical protein